MNINTLKDIKELKGKKVLLRTDFNVPMQNGNIEDDTRITEALPTIKHLIEQGAKIIIITHLGRPDGEIVEELRVDEIGVRLGELLNINVKKSNDSIGPDAKELIAAMEDGEIVLLENIRFHKEEEENDDEFSKKLASMGEIFVNDAFGTAHRAHCSTTGIAKLLPSFAGLLMEKEINALSSVKDAKRPLTMIFGGAKIDTKIGIIKHFISKADYFLMGGGIANTFLSAAGYNVANSLFEKDKEQIAREIMLECEKNEEKFILPKDVIVASEISEDAETLDIPIQDVIGDMKILDIGKHSIDRYIEVINKSETIIWNGPIGLYEMKPFREGTRAIAEAIAQSNATSILGGGDTADAISKIGIDKDKFTHISTGGGAAIEFLSGETLPAVEYLKK